MIPPEIDVDTRYLDDARIDDYHRCPYLDGWPKPLSPFIAKRAASLDAGRSFSNLPVEELIQLIGGFAAGGGLTSLKLRLQITKRAERLWVNVDVLAHELVLTPLRADDAGAFEFALRWYAEFAPDITVGVGQSGLFWIYQS